MLTSAGFKRVFALLLIPCAGLVASCGRHGPVELPPGVQETKQGDAAMKAIFPQPTPSFDSSAPSNLSNQTPPSISGAGVTVGSPALPLSEAQAPASAKKLPPPDLKKNSFLDSLL